MRFRRRAGEFVDVPVDAPDRPPMQGASLLTETHLPVAAQEHHREILERFQRATVNRELAVDLNAQAERAMIEAIEQHEEARRELRRVSEGHI